MMRRFLTIVLLAALAVCLGGCELFRILGLPFGKIIPFNPKPSGEGVEVFRDVQFQDIPVPICLKLRRDSTFSYRSKLFRIGRFKYQGPWTLNKTWWFYYKQMPLHGWNLLSETPGDRMVELVYRKGRERCEITIETGEQITALIRVDTIREEQMEGF